MFTVVIFGLQNEDVLRMCYKQQLSDAISVIKAMYKVSLEVFGAARNEVNSSTGIPIASFLSLALKACSLHF